MAAAVSPGHGPPAAPSHLHRDLATARTIFQNGRYTEVSTRLPGLLSGALATRAASVHGDEIAAADGQLVR